MADINYIRARLKQGKKEGKAYMIMWCDTFDYGNYASYYDNEEQAQFALDNPDSMQRAMECYDLKGDLEKQIAMPRAWALKRRKWI